MAERVVAKVKVLGAVVEVRQGGTDLVEFRRRLEAAKRRTTNLKPVFTSFEPIWHEQNSRMFAVEGVPSWPRLSPAYAARKYAAVGPMPVLVYSGRLRASLVSRSSDTVYEPTARTLRAGTKVPYSVYNQMRRPHVLFMAETLDELVALAGDYLTVPFEGDRR